MSLPFRLVLDQTGRRATCRAHWFEIAIGYRFWLRVSLRAVPEFPVFSSGSRADSPLLLLLEVAQIQPQPFWMFCRRQPRFTSRRPMHHCEAAALSSRYGLGIFRGDKGAVEFNRKTKLSKRTVSTVRSWMSCTSPNCPLSLPLGTRVSTLLRTVGSPTRAD